jgi:hypothetical protein
MHNTVHVKKTDGESGLWTEEAKQIMLTAQSLRDQGGYPALSAPNLTMHEKWLKARFFQIGIKFFPQKAHNKYRTL